MGYTIRKKAGYSASENAPTRYSALPAGKYAVSIYEVTPGEYGAKSNNKGRENIKVQFKVLDGQTGANRRIFQTIGLFPEWAPTAKNPDGSDNFTFFSFFAAVTGKTDKEFRAWFDEQGEEVELPAPSELEGRKIVLSLKVVPDEYAYNKAVEAGDLEEGETLDDFTTNDVSGFKVYDGTLPAAGEAVTSSPKVAAVDL